MWSGKIKRETIGTKYTVGLGHSSSKAHKIECLIHKIDLKTGSKKLACNHNKARQASEPKKKKKKENQAK